jgi:hypothetical protein
MRLGLPVLALAVSVFAMPSMAQRVVTQPSNPQGATVPGVAPGGGPVVFPNPTNAPGTTTTIGTTPTPTSVPQFDVKPPEAKAAKPDSSGLTPGAPVQVKPPRLSKDRERPDCTVHKKECSHVCAGLGGLELSLRGCISERCKDVDKDCREMIVQEIKKKAQRQSH